MSKQARTFDLDRVRIASPCTMSWNEMKGDDRTRHCGACKLNVYNVAGLTKEEAQELLLKRASGERVCMRLTRRHDGTIITKDCPVGVSLARRAKLRAASMVASAVALSLYLFTSKSNAQENQHAMTGSIAVAPVMGKVAAPRDVEMTMGGISAPIDDEPEMMGEVAPPDEYPTQPSDIEPGTSIEE